MATINNPIPDIIAYYDSITPLVPTSSIRPVQSFVTDEFRIEESYDDNGEIAYHVCSDVNLLLQQNEFLSRHPECAEQLAQLSSFKSSPADALKKTLPDSQLMKYIKSRHIQTPSELKAWGEYLEKEAKELFEDARQRAEVLAEAERLEQEAKALQETNAKQPNIDNAPTNPTSE